MAHRSPSPMPRLHCLELVRAHCATKMRAGRVYTHRLRHVPSEDPTNQVPRTRRKLHHQALSPSKWQAEPHPGPR
eukprot:2211745-Prymnesium_polylepis.3